MILYSTDHCTLCEEALDLLLSMPELRGLSLRVVDVTADAELMRRYGERLPVLRHAGRELDAPFDRHGVLGLLDASRAGGSGPEARLPSHQGRAEQG